LASSLMNKPAAIYARASSDRQIAAALVYSPDRLSRKTLMVLLSEELSRCVF